MLEGCATFSASINYTVPYWLTLAGRTGTGKTHLAKAVMRQFMDQNRFELQYDRAENCIYGNTATWVSWRKFCGSVRSGNYELIEDICKEWFVIIDDIGSERDPTGFIASSIDQIFNARQKKWTLITTNLPFSEIAEKIDVRVADRMLRNGGKVIETDTTSYAIRN